MNHESEFIQLLQEVIENDLSNPNINGEYLGKEIGMSRMQLHRKLKAMINQSASEFIKNIRLDKAMELLQTKSSNVSEVTYIVGFSSPNQFSRTFKQRFGIAPSQVLKSSDLD